jgi:hypothetical protein
MIQQINPKYWQFYQWLVSSYTIWVQCMYVNVIQNYVEAIIKCRYRLTYMLILLLINLVVFLKWDHVESNQSLINHG